MHSFKEFIQLNEDPGGFIRLVRFLSGRKPRTVKPPVTGGRPPHPRPTSQGGIQHDVDPFSKADAILDRLQILADGVFENMGRLFSQFFEGLGSGYTGAFDAFRMMLRNMIADPDLLSPGAADSLLDYLFDMDMVISISEDGTQMFFSHPGATDQMNDVINMYFQGNLGIVDGLLEAMIDAFPDSLYGG